jgi:hypothetical protein
MMRGKPFQPGTSGNSKGRPKGTPNKVTADVRRAAQALVDDPAYRATLQQRLIAGTLPPAVETLLWSYAKGTPKDLLERSPQASALTDADTLRTRVAALLAQRR